MLADVLSASDIGSPIYASIYPNPFYGFDSTNYTDSAEEYLALVDGGEDGEITPFQPLLVKARGVEVIFAIDAVRTPSTPDESF